MGFSKKEEERFFDKHVGAPEQLTVYNNMRGLNFEKPFNAYFESLLGDVSPMSVLEYGCGNYGDLSVKLARRGARVVAGDLSGESVKSTRRVLTRLGLISQAGTVKMDCENLCFRDESFHLVVGRAILHHLDLDTACREIKRVMKKGGRAIFIEPMGMNPLINLYRYFTPDQRTPGEHPFTYRTIKQMERYFERVEHKEFNLFPLALLAGAGFFPNKERLAPLLEKLQNLDKAAFGRFPFLARFAWTTVISCS